MNILARLFRINEITMFHQKQSIKKRVRRGFSLTEVLLGIFLISLCGTILAATMPTANRNREKSNNQNKAMSLALKQMEAIRGMGYPNITAQQLAVNGLLDSTSSIGTNTFSFTNVDNALFDNPSTVLPSGEGRVTIEQRGIDLRRIIIEVRWVDRGDQKSLFLASEVANL